MKRFFLMCLALPFAAGVNGQMAHHLKQINPDTLVNRLGEAFLKQPSSVGLSVGLFYNGNDYRYNFGTIDKGSNSVPTGQSLFALGSISKTFISYILAEAVLEKKVRLDDDIRKYLKGSYPNLEYDGKPVRLIHLANTTSALPENLLPLPLANPNTPPDSIEMIRKKIFSLYNRQSFFDALHGVKLDTIPGTKARHNNTAIQLLAFILENIYQLPYSELVKKYILHPQQMKQTGWLQPTVKGYDKAGNSVPFFISATLGASGGMTTTTGDMLKYIKFQLNEKDPGIALTHQKSFSPDVYSIGLNWLIYKYDDGLSQIWTDGGTYGFCSYIILYPELHMGIVLLSNENDETTYGKLSGLADGIFNAIK